MRVPWLTKLRFLWVEEPPPSEDALPACGTGRGTSGVPLWLQHATRVAVTSFVGVVLMAQIIGIRLVAPVDAQPGYVGQCVKACNDQRKACKDACPPSGPAHAACVQACNDQSKACKEACRQEGDSFPDE